MVIFMIFLLLYCYMRNFCILIGLGQWYFSLIAWFVRDIWHKYHSWYFKIVSNFTDLTAREIMSNNFKISLVVFMPDITTNHAITYTNFFNYKLEFIPKKWNGLSCHSWCLSWWNNWDVCFHKFVDNSQEKKKLEDLLKELVRMTAQSEQSY